MFSSLVLCWTIFTNIRWWKSFCYLFFDYNCKGIQRSRR